MSARRKVRVGLVGYGFMGRTHSNAFAKVNQFFNLKHQPVLAAVCARDAEKVKAFCKENLTGYKLPRYIEFRTDLPKSNVGKILRRELRDDQPAT